MSDQKNRQSAPFSLLRIDAFARVDQDGRERMTRSFLLALRSLESGMEPWLVGALSGSFKKSGRVKEGVVRLVEIEREGIATPTGLARNFRIQATLSEKWLESQIGAAPQMIFGAQNLMAWKTRLDECLLQWAKEAPDRELRTLREKGALHEPLFFVPTRVGTSQDTIEAAEKAAAALCALHEKAGLQAALGGAPEPLARRARAL
jgi:hypothetical protein